MAPYEMAIVLLRTPRVAIVALLVFLRRSIGTGSLSGPQRSRKDFQKTAAGHFLCQALAAFACVSRWLGPLLIGLDIFGGDAEGLGDPRQGVAVRLLDFAFFDSRDRFACDIREV